MLKKMKPGRINAQRNRVSFQCQHRVGYDDVAEEFARERIKKDTEDVGT